MPRARAGLTARAQLEQRDLTQGLGFAAAMRTGGDIVLKIFALAAMFGAAVAMSGTGSSMTRPQVIRVLEVGTADVNLDGEGEPKAGDRFYERSALYNWASTGRGKRVGRDELLCAFTRVRFQQGYASAFCTAQFFLPTGSMIGQAFLRFTDAPLQSDIPILGGTGAYANAAGFVHVRDIGTDGGKAALAFHIAP